MTLKSILLLPAFVLPVLAVTAQRKNALSDQHNIIKINLNSDIAVTGIPVSWEFATRARQSLQIGLSANFIKDGDYKTTGWGFAPEYRFYLSKNKPGISGVYAGPFASVNFLTESDLYYNGQGYSPYKYNSTVFYGGLLFGHQWAWQSGFDLDLNIGLGIRTINYRNRYPGQNYYADYSEGLLPRIGVAVGYAF